MSFRLKTILGVALIEAVLLTILVWSGLRYIESTNEREFVQRAQATVNSFAVTAKDAVLATDLDSLESFVSEVMTNPGVLYARVVDSDGQVLAAEGDATARGRAFSSDSTLEDAADGVFDTSAMIRESGVDFGRVDIGVSVSTLRSVIEEARHYSVAIALIEMALVALFSLLLGIYLTRQLANLTTASERIAAGELGYQVAVRGNDELATTARAFNLMSAQVKRSYDKLSDRERDLRAVVENIQDGILMLGGRGEVVEMSPAAQAIFGHPVEAELSIENLIAAQDCEAVLGALADPRSRVWGALNEVTGRHLSGVEFPMELTLTRIIRGEGDIVVAVVRDISERKEAEFQLKLQGRTIEASRLGVSIVDATDPTRPLIYVNPAFEAVTGYARDEVIGRNCRFLQGPDADPDAVAEIRRAIAEERDARVLLRNHRKDGTAFWNELLITPIRDDEGRVTHFLGLQDDVSERVENATRLAESEAYLRGVLDSTHDAIVVSDEHGVVESFNRGAEMMFRRSASEMVGRNVSELTPEPHRGRHDGYLRAYRESGLPRIIGREREFEAQRADGTLFPIALRVNEMTRGGRRSFIGVIHDITERKQKETALREAKETAEEVATAKSQFLANMSHEIRTPMHGVLGALEMLRDTALSPSQSRYTETASTSAEVLLTVIDEILDFSRLEAGKLRIETIDFDPRKAVEDVVTMLSPRAHEAKIEIASYIAPTVPPRLRGDPIRLRQILINLVGNALKFTETGEVVVNAAALPQGESGCMVRFEVVDTGVGIPRSAQGKLFDPFTQADGSTSRRFGGTGLGLTIARRLVELMGGEIGVVSEEGVGSTFWFSVPFETGIDTQASQARDLAGRRILVVDDNATNRIIMHRYLSSWGCSPGSAADGEEALAKMLDSALAGQPYEVVILDQQMPRMDGTELAARVRAESSLREARIVMVSSEDAPDDPDAALGIDIWLTKPLRQSDLHDAIATVFGELTRAAGGSGHRPRSRVRFSGERILLVEDNPTSQILGKEMLEQRGVEVETAKNGLEAVTLAQQVVFDVILMDVQMPEIDGYEATRRIREWEQRENRRHTPIVALTAHALARDRERCLEAGMDDYLVKPYSQESLSNIIFRWLRPPTNGGTDDAGHAGNGVFESTRIAQVRDIMGESFGQLLREFQTVVREQAKLCRTALEGGDMAAALDAVHRVKNNAGDLGATELFRLSSNLERRLAAKDTDPDLSAGYLRECERASAAVDALMEGSNR